MSTSPHPEMPAGIPVDLCGILACPRCHGALAWSQAGARCEACKLDFPVQDGLLDFVGPAPAAADSTTPT